MPKWKKNGWKLSVGGEVKNKDQLMDLDKAIEKGVNVKWVSFFVERRNVSLSNYDRLLELCPGSRWYRR
mgnify:CR=1 FL=1